MLRAVLDTNVIISGTIQGSSSAGAILKAWQEGRFLLVTSETLILEARRVFAHPRILKYRITATQIEKVFYNLRTYGIMTEGKVPVDVIQEDPADNAVLAAAVEGDADYIVSGDQHLKKLRRYHGMKIITPREFARLL